MDRFNGLKIVIFGHSMAKPNGGAAGVGIAEEKTYGGLLQSLNNCIVHRNAISGSMIGGALANQSRLTHESRWNVLDGYGTGTPDIIIIDALINDHSASIPLGAINDTDIDTVYGSTDYLIRKMMPRYPITRIFFKLPCHTIVNNATCPEKNAIGLYLSDYVNAVEEVCFRYGISTINSYQDSGITFYNCNTNTVDGIHLNELGARKEYELIRSTLNLKMTNEFVNNTNEEEPPVSTVVFDIKSNNITNVTYNETTNVLTAQTNSGNYDFALTDDLNSAVVMMPVANPVGLPAFVIGNDAQGNAVVLYTDGSGKISSFKKSGLVSEITQITVLDGLKPTAAKGAYVTITHGTNNVNISYGSYSRDIPYSLIPELTVKSIGCLFTGNGVSNYIIDKIN